MALKQVKLHNRSLPDMREIGDPYELSEQNLNSSNTVFIPSSGVQIISDGLEALSTSVPLDRTSNSLK